MRYIKLFEGFNEDKENLRDDISASLVELYDKGFDIQVTISTNSIIVEIKKQESFEDGEFMFDEIEDEVKQLCDYMSEKYSDLEIDYSPETRWTNDSYSSLQEIPENIIFSDIIAFDLFFTNKSGYFNKTNENYEQEDKDYLDHKASSGVNRHYFSTGFLKDEKGLKEMVRNIFIELEDTNHRVFIDVDKLSIVVDIEPIFKDEIINEIYDYSVDYDIAKECSESFTEYIKERNPNIDNRVGLNVKYNIEYYENVKGDDGVTKYKNWGKKSFTEFPGEEWRDKIFQLKIILSL